MKLNIISFNIRCCDDPNGNSIAERAPRLYKVTSEYDADIIAFQEYRPQWEPYIEKYFGDKYDIFNKYRSRDIDVESSPILWKKDKFEFIKSGYFWLSDTPEVESRGWDERFDCFRMCVYVFLKNKETDEIFVAMNTHFGFGDKGQVASAELIYDYRKTFSDFPAFITGDFNMTPVSAGYKAMTKNFDDLNAVTVNDLRDTFHDYNPDEFKDQHIDYCFIDKSIKPISQKIIDATVDGKFPSDHYGLYIELEI